MLSITLIERLNCRADDIYDRKKERIFNVHEAKNSLWDRLFFHLYFVFGPFSVMFYNNRSQLLNKLFDILMDDNQWKGFS
jgi:hypothetical protein